MIELKKLFEQREAAYDKDTMAIFDIMKPTIVAGVCQFFKVQEEQIHWIDVRYGPHPSSGVNIIVMSGVVEYKAGDEVFDDNQNQFIKVAEPVSSVIRIAIPEETAQIATADVIHEYLNQVFQVAPDGTRRQPTPTATAAATLMSLGFDTSDMNPDQQANVVLDDVNRTLH